MTTEEQQAQTIRERDKYIDDLCADLCKMEDALGFNQDQHDKTGAFVPTIVPWLERVRDLIAAEGELGDTKQQLNESRALAENRLNQLQAAFHDLSVSNVARDEARACCAEMRRLLGDATLLDREDMEDLVSKALFTSDHGKGWRSPEDYAKLEAACAEMRTLFEKINGFGKGDLSVGELSDYVNENCELALSTDCGKPLLARLEKLESEVEERRTIEADIVRLLGHGRCGLSNNEIAPKVKTLLARLERYRTALDRISSYESGREPFWPALNMQDIAREALKEP